LFQFDGDILPDWCDYSEGRGFWQKNPNTDPKNFVLGVYSEVSASKTASKKKKKKKKKKRNTEVDKEICA
jgi:hypothetical protein